jgi:hypothetical protein
LAAAIEFGSLSVSDQVGTPRSIVRMADFNAHRIGVSLGSLAILAMMGRARHFRPIVEVPELPKIGSTCGLATQLSVRWSRWQVALADNAAASVELVVAAAATERLTFIADRCWHLATAFRIAASVPQFDGEICHRNKFLQSWESWENGGLKNFWRLRIRNGFTEIVWTTGRYPSR